MTDKASDSPSFVSETEALLRLAVLAAKAEYSHPYPPGTFGPVTVIFPGFADDIREALLAAYERGRRG